MRQLGVFERGQRVGDAGPRGDRSDAGLAGQPRHGVGGEDGGRLVARVDDADAARLGGDEDRRNVAAAEGEEEADAVRRQRRGDAVAAVRVKERGDDGLVHRRTLSDFWRPSRRCFSGRVAATPAPEG